MTATVIDLDQTTHLPSRRVRRWDQLLLLGVLIIAVVTTSTRPSTMLPRLFSVSIDARSDVVISGSMLYVSRGQTLAAYRLPGGALVWAATSDRPIGRLAVFARAGTVVAVDGAGDPVGVRAFDARTGRDRWQDRRSGLLGLSFATDRVLLLSGDELLAVDVATGRTAWQRPAGNSLVVSDSESVPWLVSTADDATTVLVVDAATGAIERQARLWPAAGWVPIVQRLVSDRLFLARLSGSGSVVDAYDLPTLKHRWRAVFDTPVFGVEACGPVLCAEGPGLLSGVDPNTGAVRWTSGYWRQALPLPNGLLFVFAPVRDRAVAIVDALTFRTVFTLTGWSAVAGMSHGPLIVARDVVGLGTWFALIDPARKLVLPLGWVHDALRTQCLAVNGYLTCPDGRGRLNLAGIASGTEVQAYRVGMSTSDVGAPP